MIYNIQPHRQPVAYQPQRASTVWSICVVVSVMWAITLVGFLAR